MSKDIERLILSQITKQTDRDKQRKIGPSGIGDCSYDVGVTLARSLPDMYEIEPDDRFGFTAWRGTAIHHYIEHSFDIPNAHFEQKVPIHHLEGYGDITGSTDLYLEDYAMTEDWKCLGKYSYDKFKLAMRKGEGPSTKYRVQQHLYGSGWIKLGYPVKKVGIVVIPQHSNNVEDMLFWEEEYNQELVDAALGRLEMIWADVQAGELGDIPSQDGCYQCERIGRTEFKQLQTTNN